MVDEAATEEEPPMVEILNPSRCRVLVVEASAEIRSLAERILTREGFPVVVSANGAEALAALAVPGGFGLLLVESVTAGADVNEVIRRSLESKPSCRIIVAAAHLADEALQGAIKAGRYGWLTKPFDAGQLREAVNEALSRQPVTDPSPTAGPPMTDHRS
jgi:two-component system cell cycle sensor histidine kinase/response regulator CckA